MEDGRAWKEEQNGNYNVKIAYRLMKRSHTNQDEEIPHKSGKPLCGSGLV